MLFRDYSQQINVSLHGVCVIFYDTVFISMVWVTPEIVERTISGNTLKSHRQAFLFLRNVEHSL